jgi:hypothetical protein
MPVFNSGAFLAEAVQSILDQTFNDFELLALNDGSTDNSLQILNELAAKDARIRIINSERNTGLVSRLNDGIAQSTGKYIARMDSDDIAFPNRFELQYHFLESNPEVCIVGSAYERTSDKSIMSCPSSHDEIKTFALSECPFAHPTVMIRKDTLIKLNTWYNAEEFPAEDYDLWTRLLTVGRGANLSEVLLKYRVHEGQISAQKATEQKKAVAKIIIRQLQEICGNKELPHPELAAQLFAKETLSVDVSMLKRIRTILTAAYSGNQNTKLIGATVFNQYLSKLYQRHSGKLTNKGVSGAMSLLPIAGQPWSNLGWGTVIKQIFK